MLIKPAFLFLFCMVLGASQGWSGEESPRTNWGKIQINGLKEWMRAEGRDLRLTNEDLDKFPELDQWGYSGIIVNSWGDIETLLLGLNSNSFQLSYRVFYPDFSYSLEGVPLKVVFQLSMSPEVVSIYYRNVRRYSYGRNHGSPPIIKLQNNKNSCFAYLDEKLFPSIEVRRPNVPQGL